MTIDFLYNEGPRGALGLGRLNLGDLLCSPKSYFHLESDKRTLIIGGGIQSSYITGKKRPPEGYDKVVVWGGGLSSEPKKTLQSDIDGIDIWTIRDRDCVPDDQHWLPCVSCMHPMMDHPAVENVPGRALLYINADPVIYSPSALLKSRRIAKEHGLDFCTNRADQEDFFDKWHKCERVVTNSYHGIYWSLLAGKKVSIFGYNYKFRSLISILSLETRVITFDKQNRASLIEATRAATVEKDSVSLPDSAAVLTGYRKMQTCFAEILYEEGIISRFSEVTHDPAALQKRSDAREMPRVLSEYISAADRSLGTRMRRLRARMK